MSRFNLATILDQLVTTEPLNENIFDRQLIRDRQVGAYELALIKAVLSQNLAVVKVLLTTDLNLHLFNDLPLKLAALTGNREIVASLLAAGADLNAPPYDAMAGYDQLNDEAVYFAAAKGHEDLVKFLIENGGNPRAGDEAPLFLAIERNHPDFVEYLLSLEEFDSFTLSLALEEAIKNGASEIVQQLVAAGAPFDQVLVDQVTNLEIKGYLQNKLNYPDQLIKSAHKTY